MFTGCFKVTKNEPQKLNIYPNGELFSNFSFFSDFGLVFFGADFGVFWVISWATDAIGAENSDKYDS